MFEIVNRTPLVVSLIPGLGKDDVANMTVLAKGTFSINGPTGPLAVDEAQVPFRGGDEWNGPEPAESSVRFESDACPAKPGTDVILVGHAYADARHAPSVDVALRVGPVHKVVRVTGDRCWVRAGSAWVMSSPPAAFDRVPLIYERAFGGMDRSDPDRARHGGDDRNPVGTGFSVGGRPERLERLMLPNLEDPRQPIREWRDRPQIAGFGFVGRGWLPRRQWAGTYDERWAAERSPLLPPDFDERFHNGAPADQTATPHLRGGEPVQVSNASPAGALSFALPRIALSMTVDFADGPRGQPVPNVIDTVIIEPDEGRVVVCWRSTFPCGRKLRQLRCVVVRMTGSVA